MAALVTTNRFMLGLDREIVGGAGEEVLAWRAFWRAGDEGVEVQAVVTSGSFALRIDASATNLATFTAATTLPVVVSLSLALGAHTFRIVALSAASTLTLIEAFFVRIEVR